MGSALVKALETKGREIYKVDLPLDIRHPDFYGPAWYGRLPIDTIYHFAALADIVPSVENPRDYYDTNVTGTLNVLEMTRKYGCKKFVYAASASCYGTWFWDIHGPRRIQEHEACQPQYPYALTKYLGEQLVMHWAKVYGIPAVSVRIFNAYGPGQRASNQYGAMFKTFLAQLANGKPITIVGDGTQCRDFIHVRDVIAGVLVATERGLSGEAYNLASGEKTSINRIADLLNAIDRVYIPKRPGEPNITWGNISKLKALGWEPRVSIEDGVQELLAAVGNYKDAKVWTAESIKRVTKEWFERLSA